ncbi:MAG: radical SAM protein [Myxococcota bacterium]|nr:radical SAM protein [Myxococcota bacterium]
MKLVLVLPPLTQLNTPYPSTAYLARSLRSAGIPCSQRDLGLELMRRALSKAGLTEVFDAVAELADAGEPLPEPAWQALSLRKQHEKAIEPAMRLLSGADPSLAARILETPLLPRGPRLSRVDLTAFGTMGVLDAARHLATLYIEDLVDLITATIDPGFSIARYGHHLAVGPVGFDPIAEKLEQTTLVDAWLDALADSIEADVVGLSVPFPGTLYGALRIGRRLKARGVTVWMGGGYINTELREVDEPRLWQCVDALTYDDGEGPLQALIAHHSGGPDTRHRTRTAEGMHSASVPAEPFVPAAWYGDLDLSAYLHILDTLNPAHRLWSDNRWNKITLAHGCYWKKCAFCDIQLDYIARFEKAPTEVLLDAMEELIEETGISGFHFVDEAAPPRLMRELALGILRRGMTVSWWGNIRFEASFTPDLCRLLAASGLIAVTGGLEVAQPRLLKLMDKGITVPQAARAAAAFRGAGVMVHAYLMYGFPTQTAAETVESMEVVRQLFSEGLLDSAFWHRFVMTRHSGVYADPTRYRVSIPDTDGAFATNDIPHTDPTGADHDQFDDVLPQALAAWMRGEGLSRPVQKWFPRGSVARPKTPSDLVRRSLSPAHSPLKASARLLWLGGEPLEDDGQLLLPTADEMIAWPGRPQELAWLAALLDDAQPERDPLTMALAQKRYPGKWSRVADRWQVLRDAGLIGV